MKRFALIVACVLSASAVVRADTTIPKFDGASKDGMYVATSSIDIPDGSLPGLTNVTLVEALGSIISVDGLEHSHETLTGSDAITDPDVGDTETLSGTADLDFGSPTTDSTGTTTADTTLTDMDFTGTIDGQTIEIKNDPSQTPPTGQTVITPIGGGATYNIHSFFDVFVEISIDGGKFAPVLNGSGPNGSTEFDLVGAPLPAAAPAGLGLLAAFGIVRRWRIAKV
jgi:hypothetical protein